LCDVSASWNIADNHNGRPDVTIIKGGLIKLPNAVDNFVHASLAETMLLTLEGKFTSYSLGDDINLDKMEEIADLAMRHGFEVWVPQAPLF
jgi:predicted amino acid dehydrogenase